MSIKLLPYKAGSQSAKALAEALGIKRLKLNNSKWMGKAGDTVINWGNSGNVPLAVGKGTILNNPKFVGTAANKLKTQRALDGSKYCLPYMTDINKAKVAIVHGETIVCRTKLTGNSGDGIVIAETVDQLVDAPLYTVYKKKTQEYRVHVFDGKVISVQRKARKRDVEDDKVNWKVRNLDGGFIFARTGFDVPLSVVNSALGAMKDLRLDFGAVDVGYHKDVGTYVYEVNTACGLDGSNLVDYVEAFCDKLGIDKPARPADYVPPTLPKAGVELERKPFEPVAAEQPKVVLSNEDVIRIVMQHLGDKAGAIKEVRKLTGKGLLTSKNMVERAIETIEARKPKAEAPLGTKENPLGRNVPGAELRQIRPDLDLGTHNVNEEMVRDYTGKWAYFTGQATYYHGLVIVDDRRWVWGEKHLVPENTFNIELGNLKVKLNEEEQAALAEFLMQLKG